MPPRRRRDEEEDDDADAFGSADSQLSGSDVEEAGKEPPGLTMQAGGEEIKEKEEKEDEESANVDEKDEVEKEAKEKDEAKDNEDEKKEDEKKEDEKKDDEKKEDEKEEGSKDYADAASHVSEEAQREAKVPTNSRYFLHDDRPANEEEKEETSKETSKVANRSGRRNDKGDPDADGKWDHDMYYKLLEEAPRAKAPRVPNDSWSTMGRRKPGYGSEDWSWNTKKDDAWYYEKWEKPAEKWEKPAEARHPRRSREQNPWNEWNKRSEWDEPWATVETWEEPKKGKGRGKGNRSWKNDWTQEEEWNEEWNEEWEGEEQGEWIWKPRKGRNANTTTTTRWSQHDDRGAQKKQAEEAWWC